MLPRLQSVSRPGLFNCKLFSTQVSTNSAFFSKLPELHANPAYVAQPTQFAPTSSSSFQNLPNLDANLAYVACVKEQFLPDVRKRRLQRVRDMLKKFNCAAGIFHDPCHVRYACDASNMTIWHKRNQIRYLLIPQEGPVTLFESFFVDAKGIEPLVGETIDHWEPNIVTTYCSTGPEMFGQIEKWADQMHAFLEPITKGHQNQNVAVQGGDPLQAFALEKRGYRLKSGQQVIEHARSIKVEGEIELIKCAVQTTADAVQYLHQAIRDGVTENEVWALLHQYNIAVGGEYVETRLLNSGMRTSPWMQESSTKHIRSGELVALDADCTGPFGYFIDFSRTWLCSKYADSNVDHSVLDRSNVKLQKQRELHKYAKEQLQYNMQLCKPGMSFRELSEKCWKIPEKFLPFRYGLLAHGNGINGEYPYIYHDVDFAACGYDGVVEENMTLSFEAFIAEDNEDGVKLEEHCLITSNGVQNLSAMVPFCEHLQDE